MLDPQARALLDQMSGADQPAFEEMTPDQARQGIDALNIALGGPPEEVKEVVDFTIPGPAGVIPARLYRPLESTASPAPALVYYHGGGFVIGSLAGWDSVLRTLANASGCVVISVDYRLAPEHRFPAGLDDAYAALSWVAREASSLGIDPARIAVGGDSAGANLATVTAITARDRGGPDIAFQLLAYPLADQNYGSDSYQQFGTGHFITVEAMQWFLDHYVTRENYNDWRVHPLRAPSLAGLPPAHVVVGECDPLRDEGTRYAERLQAESGATTLVQYPGMIHAFLSFPMALDVARQAGADLAAVLRIALGATAAV